MKPRQMSFIEGMKDKKLEETQGAVFQQGYEGKNPKRNWGKCPSSPS